MRRDPHLNLPTDMPCKAMIKKGREIQRKTAREAENQGGRRGRGGNGYSERTLEPIKDHLGCLSLYSNNYIFNNR